MEPLLHFAIPFAFASLLGLSLRWSILFGFIGVLPDLDVAFHVHRSVSHSLTFPLLLVIFLVPLWKNVKFRRLPLLSVFSWASHIILDFIDGFTPLFWPLSEKTYRFLFESRFLLSSNPQVSLNLQILEKPYNSSPFATFDAVLFTSESLVTALLLIFLTLLWKQQTRSSSPLGTER